MPGRRRVTDLSKNLIILSAAIGLVAVACDSSSSDTDGGQTSATPANTSFLDPIGNPQNIQNLFEVEAENAEYWRMFSLDTYDGESWSSADLDGSEGVAFSAPGTVPGAADPPPDAQTLHQTFRVVGDVGFAGALPLAQSAEEISAPFSEIRWDEAQGSAFIDEDLEEGVTYAVRSLIAMPTAEELDRVDVRVDPTVARWTALPDDLDPRITEIAKEWTADATSDYRKVLAIQQRFQRDDFVYSTAVDGVVGDAALVDFLTRTKTGYCVHYSSAMAVMARTLGLPSRIGVGFRAGTRQEDSSYLVTTNDAHIWVEVLFPGYGWLQFEPEHGTAHPNAEPGTYLNPA